MKKKNITINPIFFQKNNKNILHVWSKCISSGENNPCRLVSYKNGIKAKNAFTESGKMHEPHFHHETSTWNELKLKTKVIQTYICSLHEANSFL